jgi:hypothetical protein
MPQPTFDGEQPQSERAGAQERQRKNKNGSEKFRSHFLNFDITRAQNESGGVAEGGSGRSETYARNVAVADGDRSVAEQQTVDPGQQAAEQGVDGGRRSGGELGHFSLSGCRDAVRRCQKK